ncbi:histidine kinase [Larkinella sp.]|uniref:sensor histidine kinase n=1 Tax=Larkinella sp. TaxID=2034517 RepID=UPI003BA914F1
MNRSPDYPTLRIFLDGMLCMMLVYTLISYVWHRKRLHFLYSAYIISLLSYFHLNDLCHFYIDTHAPDDLTNRALLAESVVQCFSFIIYGRFAIALMDLRTNDRVSVRLINAIAALALLLIVFDSIKFLTGTTDGPFQRAFYIASRYFVCFCALATVPRILRLRNQVVSFFITGTLFYVSGALLGLVMHQFGWDSRQPDAPFTFPMIPMEIGVVLETICITVGISLLNRQTEREKIQFQAQLIEQLQENERKQQQLQRIRDDIARDLHDEIGSDLSGISILSGVAIRQLDHQPEKVRTALTIIGETAQNVMSAMREIIWSLNSAQDSMEQLSLRLKETAYNLFEHTPVDLEITFQKNLPAGLLATQHRRDFFLIYKEILHNIVRHAHAHTVTINLTVAQETLGLVIRDNGVGFNPASLRTGSGLTNMHQRMARLGGEIDIRSQPGEGTTITVRCPVPTSQAEVVAPRPPIIM